MTWRLSLRGPWTDDQGSATIETAFVAPLLLMMSLGAVDAGMLIARQNELQSAAAEAASIVRAVPPADQDARDAIEEVVRASTGVVGDNVVVEEIFRCGTAAAYVTTNTCLTGEKASIFIRLTVNDTDEPMWTQFGIGEPVDFTVVRTVQIK